MDRVLNDSAVLVVHFNDDRLNARKVSGCFPYFDKAIVLEQILLLNTSVDIVELIIYDEEHRYHIEPNMNRLTVARSRLGSTDYGLLTNNCEAFMHEICVGVHYSRQAEFILDLMHTIMFIPYILLVHSCHRWVEKKTGKSKMEYFDSDTFIFEMDEGPILNESATQAASYGDSFTLTEKFNKNHSIHQSSSSHSFIDDNICVVLLLVLLFILYKTCIVILTRLGKLCYQILYVSDFYT